MNVLESTRKWMRETCPLIDKNDMFNANYLGAETTAYSLSTSSETHTPDICGFDKAVHNLVFSARLPYGKALQQNIAAADFFTALGAWLMEQERAHNYPVGMDGYTVAQITTSNAGLVVTRETAAAHYQLQIKMTLEEV